MALNFSGSHMLTRLSSGRRTFFLPVYWKGHLLSKVLLFWTAITWSCFIDVSWVKFQLYSLFLPPSSIILKKKKSLKGNTDVRLFPSFFSVTSFKKILHPFTGYGYIFSFISAKPFCFFILDKNYQLSWIKSRAFYPLNKGIFPSVKSRLFYFLLSGFQASYMKEYCPGTGFAGHTEQLLNKQISKLKICSNEKYETKMSLLR